ncbi:MAG: transposase, partial [Verrucomicrobia bacterium]|nr:transposase [Verrucomicrobiota bacterium]
MKYYTSTTQFNCGIDLHARQMYVCLMDRDGKKLVHTNIKHNDFDFFLKLIAPYRHDLTVCCECMFGWYWLADACQAAGLHFVLAHALYLKAIHGGKNKNDRIDS